MKLAREQRTVSGKAKMETTFYHDETNSPKNSVMLKKSAMTLDFSSGARGMKRKANALLASPDMSMLGLASPELERLIIQQSGMVNTTPTPTQFLFPRSVTEEQEAYARGFVDALEKLHKDDDPADEEPQQKVMVPNSMTNGMPLMGLNLINVPVTSQVSTSSASATVEVPHQTTLIPMTSFTTTTSLPGSILPTSTQGSTTILQTLPTVVPETVKSERMQQINHNNVITTGVSMNYQSVSPKPAASMNYHTLSPKPAVLPSTVIDVAMKEEPQTVPCIMDSADLSPINMETQEVVKLDRKRARNRVAARKCRERKLERISRLEERVDQLKGQNTDLSSTAQTLRDQVVKLKRQIMEHVESGCQVMLAPNMI